MTRAAPAVALARVRDVLAGYRFRYVSEAELQAALLGALLDAGLAVAREVRLSPRDRIDFVVGRVGIEVKVAGKQRDVERQLRRYARAEDLDAVLLVTCIARHRMPTEIDGKPVLVLNIVEGSL